LNNGISQFPCRVGICKECIEYVQLIEKNQIFLEDNPQQIWKCPECDYPNHINDFLAIDNLTEHSQEKFRNG